MLRVLPIRLGYNNLAYASDGTCFFLLGQIAANMLHIARVAMLNSNRLRKLHISEAIAELDKAKFFLYNSTRFAYFIVYYSGETILKYSITLHMLQKCPANYFYCVGVYFFFMFIWDFLLSQFFVISFYLYSGDSLFNVVNLFSYAISNIHM